MATERIIGVDFGTSTSVIRVKRYQDERPVGDPLEAKQIVFDQGNTMVPTLVQKRDSGESVYFGHDASISHKGTKTYANFKVDLESTDADARGLARELTAEFFAFMAKTYKTQSEGGHLGESSDQERTIISYPVKWSDETKAFMCETAKAAGFPNVEGLDEAQAAIQAVTVQNADMLTRKGYFKAGVPVNILLIDMGAGTTDLVLCRHTPGTSPKTEILCTWPQKGTALFGGHEVDELLKRMICDSMPEDSVNLILKKLGNEQFKAWKESVVSPALWRKETVEEFSALDNLTDLLDIEAEYSVSRDSFESTAADYLRCFPELVNGCLEEGNVRGEAVDLVILTGGHSQWYFVQDMLRGKTTRFGSIELSKVQQEDDRIIPVALPQETVALGLVYGKMAVVRELRTLIHTDEKDPTCTEPGNLEYWSTEEAPYLFFADEQGTEPITREKIVIPAPGHDYEWITENGQRVEVCRRCGAEGRRVSIVIQEKVISESVVQEPEPLGYTPDSEFEFGNIGEDYFVRKYVGKREVVSIPPVVRGRKVVAIGEYAFGGKNVFSGVGKRTKKVIIPDTVKRIEIGVFAFCGKLETVIAHPGIEYIGSYAFCGCKSLQILDFGMGVPVPKVVKFPLGLKEIGAHAFLADPNGLHCKCVLQEVTLNKNTKVRNPLVEKTFNPKCCAVFYYDE